MARDPFACPSKIALIFPPACDPTAPYLSLAALAGFLRSRGREVVAIDANVEGFDRLLSTLGMTRVRDVLEARLAALDRLAHLSHGDALAYGALWRARADARTAPPLVDGAKAVLRDPERFFDEAHYARAVETIESALRAVSAAYFPTHVDFMSYRTPFGLLDAHELEASARPEASPFEDYIAEVLLPRLAAEGVAVVGLSVCFPGQLHPAYLMGLRVKQALPRVHLTMGGAVVTQLLGRLSSDRRSELLRPFDSAVLFEGEHTLLALLEALDAGGELPLLDNVVTSAARHAPLVRRPPEDLSQLPCPDFDGLPLPSYFAPELVLPYDPTRGCYWGRCAFCHYGLTERGTATYRERAVPTMVEHLRQLAARYRTSHFYLSHDSVKPKTLVALSRSLATERVAIRWGTDLKPEPYVNRGRAETLRRGGAVACALGVESASDRILRLIDKGQPASAVATVIENLAQAGIAVEAMCFTDFPTETADEARQTLRFVRNHRRSIAGFIVGEFGITHGSRVACESAAFDIGATWTLEGDRFGLALQYAPRHLWKTEQERESIEEEIARLSNGWALRAYPWSGAVSTAHTILHYSHFGPNVFRDRARAAAPDASGAPDGWDADASFDLAEVGRAEARESAIWARLLTERRSVAREAYDRELGSPPPLGRAPKRYRLCVGVEPAERRARRPRMARRGRPRGRARR